MTSLRWLVTFTTTYPLDACLWLIAGIFASGAVLFGVGLYRAMRREMREDWCGENWGAHRW